ncbi:hypothetical protein Efla_006125 [Eimeria flavescens]
MQPLACRVYVLRAAWWAAAGAVKKASFVVASGDRLLLLPQPTQGGASTIPAAPTTAAAAAWSPCPAPRGPARGFASGGPPAHTAASGWAAAADSRPPEQPKTLRLLRPHLDCLQPRLPLIRDRLAWALQTKEFVSGWRDGNTHSSSSSRSSSTVHVRIQLTEA